MKYRVLEVVRNACDIRYYPQFRFLFIWFNWIYTDTFFPNRIYYSTFDNARKMINKRRRYKIQSKNIWEV